MGKKLSFKGDTHKKKKKTHPAHREAPPAEEAAKDPEGWIDVPESVLALGPVFITSRGTADVAPVALSVHPMTGAVYGRPGATELVGEAQVREPSEVRDVWVCTRIPDTVDQITLKAVSSKYLASDAIGQVSADREARGMQEEWTLEKVSADCYLLKNTYGKYLGVDVVAGNKTEVRCDAERDPDDASLLWRISMQGAFLTKAKEQFLERTGVKTKSVDQVQNSGLVVIDTPHAGLTKIKKAKLSEQRLDERVKQKSDRYC